MTEATNIDALRAETWQLHTMQDAMDFADKLIDQIEAERQRADAAESYARERDSENESMALTVGRLRSELAALRG